MNATTDDVPSAFVSLIAREGQDVDIAMHDTFKGAADYIRPHLDGAPAELFASLDEPGNVGFSTRGPGIVVLIRPL